MSYNKIKIYSFYRFKSIKNVSSVKRRLNEHIGNNLIYGSILIAKEGINGTISGSEIELDNFIRHLKKTIEIRKLTIKVSVNEFIPFYRMKIRTKKEIVTIGDKTIYPVKKTGKHIHPKYWDKIINDKNYLLIDTRNEYEVNIGSFKKALNPKTNTFREFPKFIKNLNLKKDQNIAMFCTGGIRCEKASTYLIKNGFKNVYQLDGGILNYLDFKKNKKNTNWKGECFVFDNRVSVNKNLKKGKFDQCYGCRHPISSKDKKLKSYIKGVSCKYCISSKTQEKINSSLTRQIQIEKAEVDKQIHSFKKLSSKDLQIISGNNQFNRKK
jgi:UPF0176 protein